jgi:hypothetical protein
MNCESQNVIVTDDVCSRCGIKTIHVYHQCFPEMRVGGQSAEEAAERLARQLERCLDAVSDPLHREPVGAAIADVRAFLGRKEMGHPESPVYDTSHC